MTDVIKVTGPKDELEQVLRHILDVAARSLGPQPQPPGWVQPVELLAAGSRNEEALRGLLTTARAELVDCSPGHGSTEDRLESVYEAQVSALERGVRCYYLRSPAALRCPRTRACLRDLRRRGAKVRASAVVRHDIVMVDGRAAVVPVAGGSERLLIRAPILLSCVRTVFEQWWRAGSDLPNRDGAADAEETARRVLACLAAGTIDEVGARELGMSVRTYRRNVATLLQRLGAQTRFQAGARAAELGWL